MRLISFIFAVAGLLGAVRADLGDEILTALEQAVDCAGCNALLVPVQTLAHLGNDAFDETWTSICELAHVS